MRNVNPRFLAAGAYGAGSIFWDVNVDYKITIVLFNAIWAVCLMLFMYVVDKV